MEKNLNLEFRHQTRLYIFLFSIRRVSFTYRSFISEITNFDKSTVAHSMVNRMVEILNFEHELELYAQKP